MSNAISGSVTTNVNINQQLDAGANRLNAYPVPVTPSQSQTYGTGTAANQVQKVAQLSGSAAGAPVDIDLTTVACVDGTAGFSYVRELIVFNDALPANDTYVLDAGDDGVVTNPWTPWALGTHPQAVVQPGGNHRISKPYGANGYPVTGTSKDFRLNPGANTVPYRVVILGY